MVNEFLQSIGPGEKILIGAGAIISTLLLLIYRQIMNRFDGLTDWLKIQESEEKKCKEDLPEKYASIDIMQHYHEGRPARVVLGPAPPLPPPRVVREGK